MEDQCERAPRPPSSNYQEYLIAARIVWDTKGPHAGLVVAGLAFILLIVASLVGKKPQIPPAPSPQVHQENKQTVNQNIYVGGKDARTLASEQEKAKHEDTVLALMKKVHPKIAYRVEEISSAVGLTTRETRNALERLEAQHCVWRSPLDVPGGYVWFLDELEHLGPVTVSTT